MLCVLDYIIYFVVIKQGRRCNSYNTNESKWWHHFLSNSIFRLANRFHAYPKLTHQRQVLLDQFITYRNPYTISRTELFRQILSSHVQHRGHEQCGNELEWRGSNNPSWLLHDCWNHCHPQHPDWYHILNIYQGFELWVHWILSPRTIHFTNAPFIREILGLEGRTVIPRASFYGSNAINITWNRQVIQVFV